MRHNYYIFAVKKVVKGEQEMSRKGENIFKRKDGRWEGRYIHHYDLNGKAIYRYLYGKSYKEVREKKQHASGLINEEPHVEFCGSITSFSELGMKWLKNIRISVKESTFTRYARILDKYIFPLIGYISLKKISQQLIDCFSDEIIKRGGLRGKPLSAKTVCDIMIVFKSVIKFGIEYNLLSVSSEKIKLPQKTRPKIRILSDSCQQQIEKTIMKKDDLISLGIFIALYLGLRIGEICALKWSDFDFKNHLLKVERTVERISNLDLKNAPKTKLIISEPKTESSYRIIPLSEFVFCRIYHFYEKTAKEALGDFNHYFIMSGSGKICDPHNFYYKYKKFLKENISEEYTFHSLRHTFATRCVEVGFDTKTLSEILGHKSVTTTLAVYVHPTIKQKRAEMDKLSPRS